MNTPLEIIIGAILLIVLLIYIINKVPMYKEERYELLTKYRRTQNNSLKIQDMLSKYILANDALEEPILPGISCGDYLKQMKREYAKNLSDKLHLKIRRCNNRRVFKRINSVLNEQSVKLMETTDLINELQKKSPVETRLYG